MNFKSDNSGPAAPQVVEAIVKANEGYQASYGGDEIMESVTEGMRKLFDAPDAGVFLVSTGTAANALCLACLCPSWATIYCHEHSHVEEDECGAPEFYTGGAKLTLLDGKHAKIDKGALASALASAAPVGVHNVQRGALSITNATEHGSVYTVEEVAGLAELAKGYQIPVHMDGARFANAVVSLDCTPAALTWQSGIDALSFGGTKNGLLGVEAVVLFGEEKCWEFELRRKRGGHLFSKHRFLSAQMDAYLANGLWLDLARRANRSAAKLAEGLATASNVHLLHPVEANMLFVAMPLQAHVRAMEHGAQYYLWPPNQPILNNDDEIVTARLVCNWSTSDSEIEQLIDLLGNS